MATYNDLPTELTANVFSYLRQERRQPPHFTIIKELIDYVNTDVTYEDNRIVCRRIFENYASMKACVTGDPYEEPFEVEDDYDNVWAVWYGFKSRQARHRVLVRRLYVNMIEARTNQQSLADMLETYNRSYEDDDYELPESLVISEWVLK